MSDSTLHTDLDRANKILGGMPVVLFGTPGVGTLAFDAWVVAVCGAALFCCLLVVDGLFVHPPSDGGASGHTSYSRKQLTDSR
jgi:hypothetical protein